MVTGAIFKHLDTYVGRYRSSLCYEYREGMRTAETLHYFLVNLELFLGRYNLSSVEPLSTDSFTHPYKRSNS